MNEPLKEAYDFVVIGAGPGGLITALNLARHGGGYSVALVDRKDPWEEPVACAEAVHREGLEGLVPEVKKAWIREPVDGVQFIAPNGKVVTFEKKGGGLLIDRALMHKNLAETCESMGIHCHFRTRVKNISRYQISSPSQVGERVAQYDGAATGSVRARVVVDCSGPGLGFGKGEDIVQGDYDLEPAIFALVKGGKYPTNYIQMFFGKCYAPGGYAWLFPRDEQVANVGLVIGKGFTRQASPRKMLQQFLQQYYKDTEILEVKGGGIACGYSEKPFAVENLFKVGDAANMVNPISRAGILESMQGGAYAAEAALKVIALQSEEEKKPYYDAYKQKWDAKYGHYNRRMATGKRGFTHISDATFDRAANRLSKVPREKLTMGRIVTATLLANPLVLWHMRGLITK